MNYGPCASDAELTRKFPFALLLQLENEVCFPEASTLALPVRVVHTAENLAAQYARNVQPERTAIPQGGRP